MTLGVPSSYLVMRALKNIHILSFFLPLLLILLLNIFVMLYLEMPRDNINKLN